MARHHRPHPPKTQKPSWFASLDPWKQDLLAVGFLYLVTLVLFRGIVFNDGAFSTQGDTAAAAAFAHAGKVIEETEGIDPLWMPYFFSGMPTFGNVAYLPHDVSYVQKAALAVLKLFYLNSTWGWIVVFYLLAGVFMYFLARALELSRPAALFAALAFMLSPYGIGLAPDGHGSKLMAVAYLPLTVLLTHMVFERRDLLSFGLLAVGIGTLLLTNHMQIVYYVMMVLALLTVVRLAVDWNARRAEGSFRGESLKATAILAAALLVGGLIGSYIYLSVYEYAPFSIRGSGAAGVAGGLTWDYATSWSWHPQEMLTLLIPSFFGFQSPNYWGTMPFTNSTVYIGILPLLLGGLALAYRRTPATIFLAVLAVLAVLISFGKHFSLLYDLLFTALPFFNKFRAPVMILHLLAFAGALLGAYGLDWLLRREAIPDTAKLARGMAITAGVLFGLFAVAFLLKDSLYDGFRGSMFVREGEVEMLREQYGQKAEAALAQVQRMRFDLLWDGAVTFVGITLAALGILWAYLAGKLKAGAFTLAVLALLIVDLTLVIGKANFIDPKPAADLTKSFEPDATVRFLKAQSGPFRVFPLGQLFQDNTFAYHGVQSIYGYHPAKLKIYQTMLDSCLQRSPDPAFPLNMNVLNMLNVRYLVAGGRLPEDRFRLVNVDEAKRMLTYENAAALPRAFFVREAAVIGDPLQVLATMNTVAFDPSRTALLEKQPAAAVGAPDSSAVAVTSYGAHRIVLEASTSSPALLVLGEIYYPAGWKAFVDGAETEIYKTNYVLRSVVVPSGKHEVVFAFDPPAYRLGYTLSNAAWGVSLLAVIAGLWHVPAVRRRLGGPKAPAERKAGEDRKA
jgi:hypothetical protein